MLSNARAAAAPPERSRGGRLERVGPDSHRSLFRSSLATLELLFLWERVHLPRRGIEADDAAGAEPLEELAALHPDLHSATARLRRHFADLQDVSALAVVDGVVGHQAVARDADAALG